MIAARRGYALCLGALPHTTITERRSEILAVLCNEVRGLDLPGGKDQEDPQTRQYALLSLGRVCMSIGVTGEDLDLLIGTLEAAMTDYAVDRRGDVGSWVRQVAMEVITAILDAQRRAAPVIVLQSADTSTRLFRLLLQQAVEKLDRLRERTYGFLHFLLCGNTAVAFDLDLVHRRVCNSEPYDLVSWTTVAASNISEAEYTCISWPPAHADVLREAVFKSSAACLPRKVKERDQDEDPTMLDSSAEQHCERNAAIFDTLVPFIAYDTYRPSIVRGLIISIGGITESTAKHARKALFNYLQTYDSESWRLYFILLVCCLHNKFFQPPPQLPSLRKHSQQ